MLSGKKRVGCADKSGPDQEVAHQFFCKSSRTVQDISGITEQELSKALKITKRTLIEYRMNGKLPYYKIGGKILYKEQDIIEILERNKVLAFE